MKTWRHSIATAVSFLVAGTPAPARPEALGVVVAAHHALLSASEVSAGTTVYDGDQFSTGEGGSLLLRSSAAMLDLRKRAT